MLPERGHAEVKNITPQLAELKGVASRDAAAVLRISHGQSFSNDYKGPMPKHDQVKVYIFATGSGFFDENRVLTYIQREVVHFEPVILLANCPI